MNTALEYIYYIYSKFINFIFIDMNIDTNVTFGWVCITCFVFTILFKNVLALPNKGSSVKVGSSKSKGDKNNG